MTRKIGIFCSCREDSLGKDYHHWPFHLSWTNRAGLFVPFVAYRMKKVFFCVLEMREGITVSQIVMPVWEESYRYECFLQNTEKWIKDSSIQLNIYQKEAKFESPKSIYLLRNVFIFQYVYLSFLHSGDSKQLTILFSPVAQRQQQRLGWQRLRK